MSTFGELRIADRIEGITIGLMALVFPTLTILGLM